MVSQQEVIDRIKKDIPEGFEIKTWEIEFENGTAFINREIGRPNDEGTILEVTARSCSIFTVGPKGGWKESTVY